MASNNFINECKNRANGNRLGQIIVNDVESSISNSNNLQNFSIDSGCYVDGSIIGTVYIKCLSGQFIALPDNVDLIDKTLYAKIGVKYANNTVEYINMGKYTIERPKDEQTANKCEITAYDDLINKIDNKYVCGIDYTSGNITLRNLYIDVCNQLNLTPVTTNFINNNIPISNNPFTNGESNRIVLQTILKIACSFCTIDNDTNKIDLSWLSDSDEPDYIFEKSDYAILEGGKIQLGPINTVVIKNSQVDDENVTMTNDESISQNGEHTIVISEDYILYNTELRQQAITAIFNRLNGLKYVDSKLITCYGKPFLPIGAKIRIITDNGYFDTYVLKHNFQYDGTFTSTIESPVLTEQEIKTKQNVSLKDSLKNTQLTIDKQNQKIEGLVTEIDGQNELISQTIQTVDSLQLRVNKIENSINDASGTNVLYLEQSLPKSLEYLSIKGNVSAIQSGGIYPNEQLTLKGIYLIVDKTRELSSDVKKIKLPFEYLRQYNDVSDEFIFNNGECQIIRRIGIDENNDYYVLEEEIIEELEDIEIQLFDGDNYIYVSPNFNTQLYAIYPKKQASDIYATKVEVSSAIQETADSITLQTSEKFDDQNSRISTIQNTLDGVNITVASQKTELDSLSGQLVSIDGSLSEMQFKFNTDALKIAKTNDPVNSTIDNTGLKVYNYTTLKAIFNNNGSGIDTLIVTGTAQIGYLKFLKTIDGGKKYTDIFHLEELISDLTDLEVSS